MAQSDKRPILAIVRLPSGDRAEILGPAAVRVIDASGVEEPVLSAAMSQQFAQKDTFLPWVEIMAREITRAYGGAYDLFVDQRAKPGEIH